MKTKTKKSKVKTTKAKPGRPAKKANLKRIGKVLKKQAAKEKTPRKSKVARDIRGAFLIRSSHGEFLNNEFLWDASPVNALHWISKPAALAFIKKTSKKTDLITGEPEVQGIEDCKPVPAKKYLVANYRLDSTGLPMKFMSPKDAPGGVTKLKTVIKEGRAKILSQLKDVFTEAKLLKDDYLKDMKVVATKKKAIDNQLKAFDKRVKKNG